MRPALLASALLFLVGCGGQKPAPPLAADELVFRPSGKDYPRTPQVMGGRKAGAEFDFVVIEYRTVAEAAQTYADFSHHEVRVPRSLAERKLTLMPGPAQAAHGYVLMGLEAHLPHEGVTIEKFAGRVVAFRAGPTAQERFEAERPASATPAQIAAAEGALSDDRFWRLIESARKGGGGDCQAQAESLSRLVSALGTDEILGFELRFRRCLAQAYRWDLWAVAYIVNGGCSDDGFEYFRCWLIGQGRDYFNAALQNPARAADRARRDQNTECEALLYIGMEAYQKRAGRLTPLFPVDTVREPAGSRWTEEQLPQLYPELVKKFR